ncbi:hypothetical protein [Chitinophaga polysaccharea]|uniref:hypothetical protein n=1 Tax=Chitinophaga polysaccharea TaxID=1293035 RepID=UPI00115BCBAE|nr:hypothetical protein [Chitinophaga polysaccharea]
MIDGIKSHHPYLTPCVWRDNPALLYGVNVDLATGEIISVGQMAVFKGLRFEIRPSLKGQGDTLLLNGSLHKYSNDGLHNANDYPFCKLVNTIKDLITMFAIVPEAAPLHGLEIGVNIKLPFSPLRIFKQVLCYRNKPFTQIDKRAKHLGLICCLTDYDIKLYDKQAQSKQLCGYLLRFEVKVKKMRYLRRYQIITMADLLDIDKMYSLLDVLIEVLQGIIFFDRSIDQKQLSKPELNQFLTLSSPIAWAAMSKYQLTRNRQRLNDLLMKYSKRRFKPFLNALLVENWNTLFEAEKLQPFHRLSCVQNGYQDATFSHLEYVGENVAPLDNSNKEIKGANPAQIYSLGQVTENIEIYSAENAQKHICKSCGRDITGQRITSIFCSESRYGKAAKSCRNKDSNRRRDLKRIIFKAMSVQKFISITYQVGGKTYTDTLHPLELDITKTWLDRITRIDIMPVVSGEKRETIKGMAARQFIQSNFKIKE